MLTAEQQRLREGNFTASMAPILMNGNAELLLQKWRIAIGEIDEPPPNWPMRLGSYLEPFILDYHQEQTGDALTRRGEVVQHPTIPNVSCTLDAYRARDHAVLDAKVCNGWQKIDEIVAYYTPQIIVQTRCVGVARGLLLIMHGTSEPHEYETAWTDGYEDELWRRIKEFQLRVLTLTPPVPLPKIVPPEQFKTYEINPAAGNWQRALAEHMRAWKLLKPSADRFSVEIKEIKQLIPDDLGKAVFDGVSITRNRAGSVTIKEA